MGRGNANGKDESWTNTNVTAGNVLAIQSGGDTTLKGAAAKADQIIASVGGNLLLESLQDSSKYDSKNKSAGFGLTLCIPPYCAGSSSVSANASTGKMNSNFKTVTEQTGLWAGGGGFLIDVKNNTTLIGSVIASSDKAVADGLNKLTTGTLVTEDLKNTARYSGSQVSIGGGFGFGGAKASDSGLGTTKGGEVAGGASKDAGTSISTGSSGFGMGTPIVVAASGNSSSTTQSGISGGTIVIRDEAGQLALTGKTAAETIASLNRDTSGTLNAVKPIFDKEKIEAGFEIASEAQRQAGQFLTNRAKEADALKKAIDAEPEGPRRTQLEAQHAEAAKWGPDGQYRLIVTAISAAGGGNVTGGVSQFVQSAAVNYLQGLGAAQIKELATSVGGEGSPGHIALHAVLACAGATAQSASCAAGAAGASASVVLNGLLQALSGSETDTLGAEQKDQRANLLVSIIGGIAGALSPEQAATIATAARIEAENNTLRDHTQVRTEKFEEKVRALAECVGDRSCQTAAGHFEGWIKAIEEQDLPACGDNFACIQNKLDERDAYLVGFETAASRLSDPLIAGMDLLDARNDEGSYDRIALKDALGRFQSGKPDYSSQVDRFVVETMLSSPVVFAAVKGISPLDSDNSAGGGRRKPGPSGSEPPAKGSAASSNYDPTETAPGSKYLNIKTQVTAKQFELNLIQNGFGVARTGVGKNGDFTVLSNGSSTYTIYSRTSTGTTGAHYIGPSGQQLKFTLSVD